MAPLPTIWSYAGRSSTHKASSWEEWQAHVEFFWQDGVKWCKTGEFVSPPKKTFDKQSPCNVCVFLGISTKNKTEETQPKRGGRYLQQRPTCPWMGKSWDCAPGGRLSCPMQPGSTLQWPLCHDSSSSILGKIHGGMQYKHDIQHLIFTVYIFSFIKKHIWYTSILILLLVLIIITYYLHISPRIYTYIYIYMCTYRTFIICLSIFANFIPPILAEKSAPARRALGWSPPPALEPC